MLSYLNVAIVEILFVRELWAFLIIAYCFLFSWERGFSTGNSGTGKPSMLHHWHTISGEEMHTLITFIVSVMASNIVDAMRVDGL